MKTTHELLIGMSKIVEAHGEEILNDEGVDNRVCWLIVVEILDYLESEGALR